jgi:trafficking protein particle complex subunit 4
MGVFLCAFSNGGVFAPVFCEIVQLAPVNSGGIHTVDAPTFSLHCFESPTGVKFFCTSSSGGKAADAFSFLQRTYEFYADYVLKVSKAFLSWS